jgi:hypothetical protein
LNNTIFGGLILNASVTYAWAYGTGVLTDLDNDGTYEATLANAPEGVYPITITAFAGDDYDFATFEITLVVTRPETVPGPDLSWLVYVLGAAIAGLTIFFTLYQTHFKYPPLVRKVRKLRKKIRKEKKTKLMILENRGQIVKNVFQNEINAVEWESKKGEDKIPIDKVKTLKIEDDQNLKEGEL